MTHDPSVAVQVFRGLIYTVIAISAGVAIGELIHALTPGGD